MPNVLVPERVADLMIFVSFFRLQPCQYRLQDLQNFFLTIGVSVQVIPDGVVLKPPTQNVPKFGHNPSLYKNKQTLEYVFAMFDDDSDDIGSADTPITYSTGAWE